MSNHMLKRVQTLQHYMHAMDNGDIETVATLLETAEQDQGLENMILEVNAGYQYTDNVPVQNDDVMRAQQLIRSVAYQTTRRDVMPSSLFPAEDDSAQQATVSVTEQSADANSTAQPRKSLSPVFPARVAAKQAWYRSPKRWIAAVAAALLISFVLFQSNSVLASQFLSFFRVQQFKPVSISNTEANGFANYAAPSIDNLGSVSFQTPNLQPQDNLTQAQAVHAISFPLLLPQQLPQNVGNNPTFSVIGGNHGTFTFSAAKVHAYLVKNGHGNVQIPANLDGATFSLTTTTGVVAEYGLKTGNPFLVVEIPSPTIQATGKASLENLRDFMISLPGLPTQFVDQLKQLDLNSGTVPFPVPSGMQAKSVTVHNVSGLLLSADKTSKNANIQQLLTSHMVVWQENGNIYALGGLDIDTNQLLAAANSLHA